MQKHITPGEWNKLTTINTAVGVNFSVIMLPIQLHPLVTGRMQLLLLLSMLLYTRLVQRGLHSFFDYVHNNDHSISLLEMQRKWKYVNDFPFSVN